MEGNDFVTFDFLVGNEELPPSFPSTMCLDTLLVKAFFKVDKDIGQLLTSND